MLILLRTNIFTVREKRGKYKIRKKLVILIFNCKH